MSELARNGEWDSSESATGFRAGGMVLQFADGAIAACNPVAAELLGYTADELIGKRWFDSPRQFIHRDGSTFLPEENPALVALRTGQPCSNVTVGFYRSDGKLVWLRLDLQPLFRANESAPYAVVTTIADVTGQNRQAIARSSQPETMQTSEANLRLLIKYAPVCIAMFDRNMNYVALSQRWAEIYQLDSVEAVLGRSHYEVFPQIGDRWKQAHQRGLAGEIQQSEEDSFTLPDGTIQWLRWEIRPWYAEKGDIGGIVIFVEDISDRKRTEQAQRQNEQRYRALIELSPQLVFMSDPNGSIIYCNQWGLEFTGRSLEQLTGDRWASLVRPDHRDRVYQAWKTATTQVSDYEIEAPYRRADGVYRWLYTRALPVRDDNGKIAYWIGIALDISDRKITEANLRENEARFFLVQQATRSGVWDWDVVANCAYVSEEYCALMGFDLAGKTVSYEEWASRIHPEDRALASEKVARAIAQNQPYIDEYRVVHRQGVRWIRSSGQVYYDQTGQPVRMIGLLQDVSDRKSAEIALQQSEERLSLAIDSAGMATWDINMPTGKGIWSQSHFPMLGYEPIPGGAATYEMWQSRVHPDDLEAVMQALEVAQQTRSLYSREYRIIRADNGEIRWLRGFGRFFYDKNGQAVRFIGILFDTSDRQVAEQSLRESEERLRLGMQVAGFALAKFDYASNTVELSPEAAALYGLPADELVVPRSRIHATFHPEEREEMAKLIEQVLDPSGAGWFSRDHRVVWGNGEVRWLTVRKQVFFDRAGKTPRPTHAILAAIDISDRKQAELALTESESRFRHMADNAPFMVWVTDATGYCHYLSQSWYDFSGQTPETGLGLGWLNVVHPEDRENSKNIFLAANARCEGFRLEYRLRRKDGEYIWAIDAANPWFGADGQFKGYIGSVIDISDRKQAELALQESESRFRTLADNIAQLAWMTDSNGWIFWYNQRWFDYTGTTLAEMQGWGWQKVHHPDHLERVVEHFRQCLKTGEPWEDTFPLRGKDGNYRWFLSRAIPIRDEQGNVVRWFGTNTDISDRKQTEDALSESEERLRLALNAANQGLYDLNLQTGDAIVSPEYAQMLGYDPENFQETNAFWLQRLHPDDLQRTNQVYQDYIAGRLDQYQVEFRQRTKQGDWKWILSTGSIVAWDKDGNPLRMLGIHTDISDRKQAEEALRQTNAILNTINESTPTLIYVKDREGRMVVANPALLAVVGKSAQEILGKTWKMPGYTKLNSKRGKKHKPQTASKTSF